MKSLIQFLLFIFILFPLAVWSSVELIVWQPDPAAPRIVLPRLEHETAPQAASRYLNQIKSHPGFDSLRPEGFHLEPGMAQSLPPLTEAGRVRAALVANRFQHLTSTDGRIQWTSLRFSQAGADPYVVGLSADLGLKEADAREFRKKISEQFSLLVSLGGDDVSPELYGEENSFSKKTNILRDRSELALVQVYKAAGKGVFFGICRGHQLGAVADGHSLIQDLTLSKAGTTSYHINEGGKNLTELQTWHHIIFEDSLLSRFLLGKHRANSQAVYSAPVNSVHHQAVAPRDHAASKVVAYDDKDAVVEALEGKNKKSLSVQFHPEFPTEISGNKEFSNRGFQILQGVVSYARMIRMKNSAGSCKLIHTP